jgi:arabinofuranosyltransferase
MRPRGSRRALLGVVPALLALLAVLHVWVTEDAFIDFRVVQHLLAGHGPVFNLGERVEAYSNPLWVAILAILAAPFHLVFGERAPIEWIAVLVGLASAVAGVALAELGALQLARARGRGGIPLPLGALAIAVVPPMWSFATSGLETGLVMGWIGLCFRGCVRYPRAGRRWLPVVAGLGPLIRPDLAVCAVGFVAVLLVVGRGGLASRARVVAGAAALPLAYQVFRMGYFGSLVPSTAIAKEAGLARWDQGGIYLHDFVRPYHLWIPFAVVAALIVAGVRAGLARRGRRRARLVVLTGVPFACGLLHAAYVTRVGGDFMHGRMLLPAWFAMLAPVAVVVAKRGRLPTLPALILAPWALACAIFLRVPYVGAGHDGLGPDGIADEHYYYTTRLGMWAAVTIGNYHGHGWETEGARLRELAANKRILEVPNVKEKAGPLELDLSPRVPSDLATLHAHVGILGYAAGLRVHVIDRLGLADAVAAHVAMAHRGRPGHEKWMEIPWVVARFARDPSTYNRIKGASDPKVIDALVALGCGDLAELRDAVGAPLTPSRFARNIAVAWRLTRLRYPGDPTAARAALCPRK